MEPRVKMLVALYCIGSSAMLVINKGAVTLMPQPLVLLALQLFATCLLAIGLHLSGSAVIKLVPRRDVARGYFAVAVVFLATLYSNMMILEEAGVEMFIVLRSCTPFAVCILDFAFLGRELPNLRSAFSLVATFCCCSGYIMLKETLGNSWNSDSIFWCCVWYAIFVFDQIFIKLIVDRFPANGWERTLYQNAFALGLAATWMAMRPPELTIPNSIESGTVFAASMVFASCICGAVLSYAVMSLRGEVSATMFTMLGIGCKMFSILLNEIFINTERHFTQLGLVALAILTSASYEQAPKRGSSKSLAPGA
ncbi:hypothetical protein CYMTET_51102 [Cymbomonas tetramitiformis]|uniref:Uncharacterized protein n=1 Tax=Cymbomonas tetramitiformis TaxID=36881 RepID=A0AAE0BLQ7_9CHLO|nr:hypothetical protein CYMTET_51102 [Cymbomonas tetramitiformis]